MRDFSEALINAKYHLAVTERMYHSYGKFSDKRFLVGIINESAKAVSSLIKAFLIYEGFSGRDSLKNMKIFMEIVAPKYLDPLTRKNLFKILEVERAQKDSPIEYAKDEKIILLIGGDYRFLTVTRIGEFIESIKKSLGKFPGNFRQV